MQRFDKLSRPRTHWQLMVSRWEINRCSVCVATLSVKAEVWGVGLLTFHCLSASVKLIYSAPLYYLFIYRDSSESPGTDWLISFSRRCHWLSASDILDFDKHTLAFAAKGIQLVRWRRRERGYLNPRDMEQSSAAIAIIHLSWQFL